MECQRRGLRVPEDIAVAGFGNYEVAACCHPRITTVDLDCYNIGRMAARRLQRSIQGIIKAGESKIDITMMKVIERESTASRLS